MVSSGIMQLSLQLMKLILDVLVQVPFQLLCLSCIGLLAHCADHMRLELPCLNWNKIADA